MYTVRLEEGIEARWREDSGVVVWWKQMYFYRWSTYHFPEICEVLRDMIPRLDVPQSGLACLFLADRFRYDICETR